MFNLAVPLAFISQRMFVYRAIIWNYSVPVDVLIISDDGDSG